MVVTVRFFLSRKFPAWILLDILFPRLLPVLVLGFGDGEVLGLGSKRGWEKG
jgi:hypothetical protein